jgi:hypothetical protein
MRVCSRLLIIVLILLAPACSRRAAVPPAPAAPAWTPVAPLVRLYYDNAGGIQDSLRLIVRDPEALRSVWRQATSRQTEPPPLPEVNFEREMVLVVAAGRRGLEDQIQIDSIGIQRTATGGRHVEEAMVAVVRMTEGCRRFTVDAYPVEIVRVPLFAGRIDFVERRQPAAGCPRSELPPSRARGAHSVAVLQR